MKILFDQGTPLPIRPFLRAHVVRTETQEHWDTLQNGELLDEAEKAGFDLLLTNDKNLQYQQNLIGRRIAVLVLGRQQWPDLRPHVQLVVDAVNACREGSCAEVEIPSP